MSSSTTPAAPAVDLSPHQKRCLDRIYKSNRRQLVDVQPTSEEEPQQQQGGGGGRDGDKPPKKKRKEETIVAAGVPEHAYRFVLRLHAFFVAFLEHAATAATATASSSRPSGADSNSNYNVYLKPPSHSCLQELIMLSGLHRRAKRPSSSSSDAASADQPHEHGHGRGRHVRLLAPGRHVMHVSHTDFLEELDLFELQGRPKTSDYVQRHSFGAYLYHVPDGALMAVASAIRLALLTMYLRQQQQPQQQQQQQQFTSNESATATASTDGSTAATAASSSPTVESAVISAFLDHSQLHVRFVRVQPVVHMMDIKTSVVNKLLSVKGHVVKARPKQLRVATADFSCASCGSILIHEFEEGRYSTPQKCMQHPQCRSSTFVMLRPTARYQNVQQVRIQETQDEAFAHAGRTPRQLVVELSGDLVDACRPGDTVLVAAIVSAVNTSLQQGKYGKRAQETSTYTLYLRGHSVTTTSESSDRSGQQHQRQQQSSSSSWHGQSSMAYSSQQLQAITRLCHADHKYFGMLERRAFPFDLLVRSLCPSIIGHHQVKAGLLLCLLGGTPPSSASATTSSGSSSSSAAAASCSEHSMRSNSHVLIVGYVRIQHRLVPSCHIGLLLTYFVLHCSLHSIIAPSIPT
jgi:MCM OB domain